MYVPSAQQQAYYDWLLTGTGSAILRAGAGCGKSTTLVEGLSRMDGSIALMAYNKAAADDLKAKAEATGVLRQGLFISTVHSACYAAWRQAAPHAKIDENKVRNIVDGLITEGRLNESHAPFIRKLVSLAKQLLLPLATYNCDAWFETVQHFSLDSDLSENDDLRTMVAAAKEVHQLSRAQCHDVIDFDDMIYAPLTYRARFYQKDWVLGDEWQDSNPARRLAAAKMLKPNGRFVAVGDDRQAIYGFTGASADALEITRKEHNAIVLPLSVTYRCPKAVVNYAHTWVPVDHLTAHESAPEGVVRPVLAALEDAEKVDPWFLRDPPGKDDAVLCRTNKPLVETAYAMLRAGVACKVEGRDIGNGLIQLAERWKVRSLDALETRLEKYLEREVKKAQAKKSETAEQAARDKVDTLMIFINRCRAKGNTSIACVVADIRDLFADGVKGVTTLCSLHKSKGREWPRVYWLQIASTRKRDLQEWEKIQESNLCYVGATRAKSELILVPERA